MVRLRYQAGFTYLALLFFVAIMGALLALTGQVWSTTQQRVKERELLFVGREFRQAIGAYYEHTPGRIKRYPGSLEDLLLDKRQAGTVRHLRKIYTDPLTLQSKWGLVRALDGGISGIYSVAPGFPLKNREFFSNEGDFNEAQTYAGWRFVYQPRETPSSQ